LKSYLFNTLLQEIRACRKCAEVLPLEPNPIIQVSQKAKILIVGQAPGRRVHETGIPFNDPSGDRLRDWMGISKDVFYDATKIAIVPMGFCFPGTGKSGDLPPRAECAAQWRTTLINSLTDIKLTLIIGRYAMDWHLKTHKRTVTATVEDWKNYWPDQVVLPHPSPRNNIWLKKNSWFEDEVLPPLKRKIQQLL